MKKHLVYLLMGLALASCAQWDESTVDCARDGTISITLKASPMTPNILETRSTTNEAINDFWVFSYDVDNNLISDPLYFTGAQGVIPYPEDRKDIQVKIIANTGDEALCSDPSKYSTIDALESWKRSISASEELKNLMNGEFVVTSPSFAAVECTLHHTMAKLSISLKNQQQGTRISYLRICNVPNEFGYLDGTEFNTDYDYFDITTSDVITVFDQQDNLPQESSFEYYLPRNCQGIFSGTTVEEKNLIAPQKATYIEILKTDENGTPIQKYRFYPGMNMVDDFNIIPNFHYKMTITINEKGDAAIDSRITEYETLPGNSNSYIINSDQTIYQLPISRVNEFWSNYADEKLTPINGTDEWVAEVIWQDADHRLITFCDEYGSSLSDTFTDTGNGFYFKLVETEGTFPEGNVVIGVRSASEAGSNNYLWSWHLWITDYNPDYQTAGWDGRYIYPVPGGEVHRYADGNGGNTWTTDYNNRYIMDRNLGAMSANRNDGHEKVVGLYYQFGRKDPFLGGNYSSNGYKYIDAYGINGTKESLVFTPDSKDNLIKKGIQATIMEAVRKPYCFYYAKSSDWANPNQYRSSQWNNPAAVSKDDYSKGIFDPCPPGWKVPKTGSWDLFKCNPSNYGSVVAIPGHTVQNVSGNLYAYKVNSTTIGEFIYDNSNGGANLFINNSSGADRNVAFYPSSNYRSYSDGLFNLHYTTYGYSWTSAGEGEGAYFFFFDVGGCYPKLISSQGNRSAAMPVRCVKQ